MWGDRVPQPMIRGRACIVGEIFAVNFCGVCGAGNASGAAARVGRIAIAIRKPWLGIAELPAVPASLSAEVASNLRGRLQVGFM